jgi:hypothetical protein
MTLRFVAIPLIAAICLGSPATASTTTDEQQVRGRGARDRSGNSGGTNRGSGGNSGENRGGGSSTTSRREGGDSGGEQRRAERRGDGDNQRNAKRGDRDNDNPRNAGRNDRDNDDQRVAVPRDGGYRGNARSNNRPVVVNRNRPDVNIINIGSSYRGQRYYSPYQYDRWARQYYRWSPIGYAPWSLIYGSIGYANFGVYGSGAWDPYYGGHYNGYHPGYYGYSPTPWQVTRDDFGGVRLRMRPRDAQVFVDGYYAGLVDDFDGTFQSLRLAAGGHKIEIRMPGFEDLELDVHVQPGRTITLSEILQPRP